MEGEGDPENLRRWEREGTQSGPWRSEESGPEAAVLKNDDKEQHKHLK